MDDPRDLSDALALAQLALMHFRDGGWAEYVSVSESDTRSPSPASLLFASERALGESRTQREAEARSMLPGLLEAAAHHQPLTLYRDAALTTT